MKNLSFKAALLAVGVLVGCGPAAPTTGTLSGTITAVGGGALAGVAVATNPATTAVVTDAAGKYSIADVPAATYKVTATFAGYTTKERANVAVAAGATVTLDFALDPATGGAKLTVKDLCGTGNVAGAKVARTGATDVLTGTDGIATLTALPPGAITFTITADAYLPATATGTVTAGGSLDLTVDLTCQALAARTVAAAYLADLTGPRAVVFTAKALHDTLNDGDTTNDPPVISTRSAADYALGHVPGSISIPYKEVADDASLTLLGAPNPAKAYKAYCYTGHTGGIATAVLNLLGYKTSNMKFGFVAWTRNTTARTASGTPPVYMDPDYPTVTEATVPTATFTPPVLTFAATTAADVLKLGARAYLKDAAMKPVITATVVKANLDNGNTSDDPFIVDVRAKVDYDAAHIPGSINLPTADLLKPGNLEKIPTDREVVVVCYTGHTGALATGVLGTLGYKKVTNLKYGFAGWKKPATLYNDATDSNDYTYTTGTTP